MSQNPPSRQTHAPLRIDGAEMRLVSLPLVTPFTIATGTMHDKTFPLLILKADGLEGYGEGVMDPVPDYLDESIIGSMDLVRTVLLPQVIGKCFANPAELEALLTGERWTDPKETQPEHAADAKALAEVIRIVEAKP